jgi:hypothetical protein
MNDDINTEHPHTKRPAIEQFGTYILNEAKKITASDGVSYEVPRGAYPVVGSLTADGKHFQETAIIFTATNAENGKRKDIAEFHRALDIPAMIQNNTVAIEKQQDNSLKFPLAMFTPDVPEKKQSQTQAPAERLSVKR